MMTPNELALAAQRTRTNQNALVGGLRSPDPVGAPVTNGVPDPVGAPVTNGGAGAASQAGADFRASPGFATIAATPSGAGPMHPAGVPYAPNAARQIARGQQDRRNAGLPAASATTGRPENAPVAPPSPGAAPSGWDPTKWANPQHTTPKYVVGRILASNPNTPEGRAAAIAQIQQAFPGATFNGKDKVDIPGLGPIDIWGNASGGEFRPQWIPDSEVGAPAGVGMTPGSAPVPINGQLEGVSPLLSGDPYSRIQEALAKLTNQGTDNIDALIQNLQGIRS